MFKNKITVALIGVGGYGQIYASALLNDAARHGVQFVAGVDPFVNSQAAQALVAAGVPVYASQEELYRNHQVSLSVISSPIQYHCTQTVLALANGSHVLVEKPIAGNVDQAQTMRRARDEAGLTVAVGYQW